MHFLVDCIFIVILSNNVGSVSYSLNISPDELLNEVDEKFLSFSVDPGLLLRKSDENLSKQSICMATALAPAYLRVAGPSTDFMSFNNFTVTVNDQAADGGESTDPAHGNQQGDIVKPDSDKNGQLSTISHDQWQQFVHWAQSAGFQLVFGLNNRERTENGLWDPNAALSILTIADYANLTNIYWELGDKCHNQSVEEFFADSETLRVILETFPANLGWKVVSGDVTDCVHTTKEFRDYYSLAAESADAIFMNSQTSDRYLSLMTEEDRDILLRLLNFSPRPLWLLEPLPTLGELERAADWLTSLGHAARNGYHLHYRQLNPDELYKPTLSFYMALLFKNLVGSRVIEVEAAPHPGVAVFAHCTTLRHKVIPGAVTIYATNMQEQAARVTLRWTRREAGGDVMRFILTRNQRRNIVVNSKEMENEGDILPVVKRVRPYKSLILNIPPQSFGFWVLANTNIKACQDFETENSTSNLAAEHSKIKRSVIPENDYNDISELESSEEIPSNYLTNIPALQERIDAINSNLKTVNKYFKSKEFKARKQIPILSKRNPIEIPQNEKAKKITTRRLKYSDFFVKPENKDNYEYENRNKITRVKRSLSEGNPIKSPRFIFSKERKDGYSNENEMVDEIETAKKITDYALKYLEYFDQSEDDNSTEFTVVDPLENVREESETPGLVNQGIWKLITGFLETNTILNRFWEMFS